MTTCSELDKILDRMELETVRIELKRKSVLKKTVDLVSSITAFANRYGGMIIIGIKNNGDFEGFDIIDVDGAKGVIDNICHDRCSPPVDYSTEFLRCGKGDVLIIHVEQRKGIPHACIEKNSGEIKNRVYYVRTSHGKRLVTDSQLESLFKYQKEIESVHSFMYHQTYDRKSLGFPFWKDFPNQIMWEPSFINSAFQNFSVEDVEMIKSNEPDNIANLFIEILPLAVLSELALPFSNHWDIYIEKFKNSRTFYGRGESPKKLVLLKDIVQETQLPFLSQTSVNVQTILLNGFQKIHVPEDATIDIQINEHQSGISRLSSSVLKIKKEDLFTIEFKFNYNRWSVSLGGSHPLFAVLSTQEKLDFQEKYATIGIRVENRSEMNFFDYDIKNVESIQNWMNNIREIIDEKLNWERYLAGLPSPLLYRIDYNLRKLMR